MSAVFAHHLLQRHQHHDALAMMTDARPSWARRWNARAEAKVSHLACRLIRLRRDADRAKSTASAHIMLAATTADQPTGGEPAVDDADGKSPRTVSNSTLDHGMRQQLVRERVDFLRKQLAARKFRVKQLREEVEEKRSFLQVRCNAIVEARHRLDEEMSWLDANYEMLSRNRESLFSVLHETFLLQATAAQELSKIFPVDTVDRNTYTIRSTILPNSNYNIRHDAEQIAAALGWICDLLRVISSLLDIPTRFQIRICGSRSNITDPFSGHVYPLYERGTTPAAFEYGVYLLNKCITELLAARGVPAMHLQMTLANVKALLDSVCHAHVDLNNPSPYVTPKNVSSSSASVILSPPTLPLATRSMGTTTATTRSLALSTSIPSVSATAADHLYDFPSLGGRAAAATGYDFPAASDGYRSHRSFSLASSVGVDDDAASSHMGFLAPVVDARSPGRWSAAAAARRANPLSGEWRIVNGQLKRIGGGGGGGVGDDASVRSGMSVSGGRSPPPRPPSTWS
ncbi:hypothetical protein AMAG_05441 [Allomyces macrogynus ATCC 38327]|uniref:Autophagy-related protein 14 n=2 Tax=Allomyces macrogynus (strain ATCC 38327) TaxID=578462 RepID=A0A0L0SC01_ALLM3|nr:hypothetical protein AMAG_05441 [Allomyces macrogynus ATCC 38327]|eukprot:KNE60001.1 hypothetical protein AMAG_05441 [Allomyces macrogynus ATCC 38327]